MTKMGELPKKRGKREIETSQILSHMTYRDLESNLTGFKARRAALPAVWQGKLHLSDFYALIGTYFNTAHTTYAFSSLIRVGLAVVPHLVYSDRADIYTFAAAGAAVKINVDKIHLLTS